MASPISCAAPTITLPSIWVWYQRSCVHGVTLMSPEFHMQVLHCFKQVLECYLVLLQVLEGSTKFTGTSIGNLQYACRFDDGIGIHCSYESPSINDKTFRLVMGTKIGALIEWTLRSMARKTSTDWVSALPWGYPLSLPMHSIEQI